jgi:hydroxyethylthiazole kinase-like sugar kinase family protein
MSSVTLAEIEIEAEYEDVKVKELAFTVSGSVDFSNTLDNVRLIDTDDNSIIADGAVVTKSGATTIVTFKKDFVVYDKDNLVKAELVADLNSITGRGDATSAKAGTFQVISVAVPSSSDIK